MEEKIKKFTQKTIKIFINEIYNKAPKKYLTNKTDVYRIGVYIYWDSKITVLKTIKIIDMF